MEAFEEKAAEEGIEPRFWKRNAYVDDVFSLIKKDRAQKFLVHLNSQDETSGSPTKKSTSRENTADGPLF